MTAARLGALLFPWHDRGARDLEIRRATTPWGILVAEVMSQQTQIERVGPAWRRFVDRWPTPNALAAAGTRELIAAWSGLGYNRRALALRDAARRIVLDHAGAVPGTVEALEALPGIGPYTARAVAAAAFGVPVAPLDVNVRRVVGRLAGRDPRDRDLQAVADALVDRADPRRWANAVMDLADAVCTPAEPACDACPLRAACVTRGAGNPAVARRPSRPFPHTTRWLRGRLLASLAESPAGAWVALPAQLGVHPADRVLVAAADLERDGFIELRGGQARVRA